MDNVSIGRKGESLAREFFKQKGFTIVAHNFHCRCGEIDLIIREKHALRFVEVKYRRSTEFGLPQESVQKKKQDKIRKTALFWLKLRRFPMDSEMHFDVLAISEASGKIDYDYIEDAF
jgi:putative endonuclease